MNRENFTLEGCATPPDHLPDYWADAEGLLQPEKRSRRSRAYRADLKQLQRWFVILIVTLLVVAFGARYGYERMVERKDAEIEAIKAVLRGPVTEIDHGCNKYVVYPYEPYEGCNWTVWKF